jgi:putative sterol carrier protein
MASRVQEIFQRFGPHHYEPLLRAVKGSYLFDIDQSGCWFVSVQNGTIDIESSRCEADCVIRCSETDFVDIAEGRRNLITAALQGRVQIEGNLALAQKFHGLVGARIQAGKGGA